MGFTTMVFRLRKRVGTDNLRQVSFLAVLTVASVVSLSGCAGLVGAPAAKTNSGSGSGPGGASLAVETSSLPAGTTGTAYSATLEASGGTTPYSWKVASGSLPAGLTLNVSSGAISGNPSSSGTSTFTAEVKDANSTTAQKSFSVAVAEGTEPLTIATTSVPSGSMGTTYSATLQASGGSSPYSWKVASGALPTGLSLNASSGAISGKPSSSGTSTFTAEVTDASSSTAKKSFSVAVAEAAQPLTITTTSVPNGSTNTAYSAFLYAGGGQTPYNWAISAGSLPTGLALSGTGDITGVPTAAGNFSFTVKVTDSSSPANTAAASFSVSVAQGTAYSVSLAWPSSPSSGVAGYNVYRSTVSGSGYTKINTGEVTGLGFVDGSVLDGATYFYVVTALDSSGNESNYSPQAQMAVP
jgi:hypothetical protein